MADHLPKQLMFGLSYPVQLLKKAVADYVWFARQNTTTIATRINGCADFL